MLVQVEATCLFHEKPTGISAYGRNLVNNLADSCSVELALPFSRLGRFLKYGKNGYELPVRFNSYNYDLKLNHPDIVHGIDIVLPNWKRSKKILTIHDIYLFLDPRDEIAPKEFREKKLHQLKKSINIADHFITVSHKTKEDFCEFFSINESKVSVTHLGFNKDLAVAKENMDLPDRYFLFIGTLSERKNCLRMLEAFSMLKDEEDLHFVFAGSCVPNYPFKERIKHLGLEKKVIYLNYVSNDQIEQLYQNASSFIFPTLYEGFGIPLLEAASRGIPVLASKQGAAPEVLGEDGIFVDAKSSEEIAQGMKVVLRKSEDMEYKNKLIAQSQKFSWENTARETLNIYEKVMNS